jgi:cold shock CspA family protein
MLGRVRYFDRFSGRAQIIGEDQRCYWTHRSEFVGVRSLETGQRHEYSPIEGPRGPRVGQVRPYVEANIIDIDADPLYQALARALEHGWTPEPYDPGGRLGIDDAARALR